MRHLLFIPVFLMFLLPNVSFGQDYDKKIIGTWEMTSTKFTYPDGGVMEETEFKYPAIRIYTKTYYSFGRQNNNGSLAAALGGKYSIKGNILTQERNYHVASSYVGKTTDYEIKIEGEKFSLKGVSPNKILIEEEYKRIE